MGHRADGPPGSGDGLLGRHRGVAVSLVVVAAILSVAVGGATVLDGGGASIADAAEFTGLNQADSTEIDSCTVIDEPDEYELTGDVEGTAEDACIHVRSDDVVLDGNGHTVRGGGADSGVGILVFNGSREGYPREGPALSNVTVRNLTVSNWSQGVQAGETRDSGPTVRFENVAVTDSGRGMSLFGVDDSRFANVSVTDNERAGVVVWETSNLTADGITARRNGGSGISFSDVVANSSLDEVTVAGNDGHGIHFSTAAVNNTVSDATVRNNDGAGVAFIDSSGNLVRNSTIAGNTGPGVLSDPAGDDRVDNVSVADNGIAYRNEFDGTRYGVHAADLRLDTGVVASFDTNVSAFDGAESVPEPPRDASLVGPAANVSMSEGAAPDATATITFPYAGEAVGNESTLGVVRYRDGAWRSVTATSVDAANQTVTATVGQSGVFVPVYVDQIGTVSGDEAAFVVNATNPDDVVAYGFVVEGQVETTNGTALPAEAGEDIVAERADGTTVVLGDTGDDGGDTFVVTGDIVRFATQPRTASVELRLDGEPVTDRLTDDEAE